MKNNSDNKDYISDSVIIESNPSELDAGRLEFYKQLGLKIAYYRKLSGMSQLTLSEKINVSRTYMSNIESPTDRTNPTMNVIYSIAKTLNVPLSKLFDTDNF